MRWGPINSTFANSRECAKQVKVNTLSNGMMQNRALCNIGYLSAGHENPGRFCPAPHSRARGGDEKFIDMYYSLPRQKLQNKADHGR